MKSRVLLCNDWAGIGGAEHTAAFIAEELEAFGEVELVHGKADFNKEIVRSRFGLELRNTTLCTEWPVKPIWDRVWNPIQRRSMTRRAHRPVSSQVDVFVAITHNYPPFAAGKLNILHLLFPFDDAWSLGKPFRISGRRYLSSTTPLKAIYHQSDINARLASYSLHTVNSEYTGKWARRRWSRSVDWKIWYPPISLTEERGQLERSHSLLAVGRLRPEKQPPEIIDWFRELSAVFPRARLTMAGGSSPVPSADQYIQQLTGAASGLNVQIAPNIDSAELIGLYRSSRIFWHSMGYGVPADKPEAFEHFGMTTVEAMSSGCVPVVFGKGGQVEIVEHGVSGFLWNDPGELIKYTLELLRDSTLCQRMAGAAIARAQKFGKAHFRDRLRSVIRAKLNCEPSIGPV